MAQAGTRTRTRKKLQASLAITLVRSPIGRPAAHKLVAKGLGFRKLNQTVIRPDTPAIRGMISKIKHMVTVKEAGV